MKKTIAHVKLKYNNVVFKLTYNFGYEYPDEAALYMWEEGNYSCDAIGVYF